MPWTTRNYPPSMKNLPSRTRGKAIEIANAILAENKKMKEGVVIATAIKKAEEATGIKPLTKTGVKKTPAKKTAAKKKAEPVKKVKSKTAKKTVTKPVRAASKPSEKKKVDKKKSATAIQQKQTKKTAASKAKRSNVATKGVTKKAPSKTKKRAGKISNLQQQLSFELPVHIDVPVSKILHTEQQPAEVHLDLPSATTPKESHLMETILHQHEEVFLRHENKKAGEALAARKHDKRFYRNRGNL